MTETATPCFHCGLATAPDTPYSSEIDGAKRFFCCPGCETVAKTISKQGFEEYYTRRTANASSLLQRKPIDFTSWDEPALQQDFVDTLPGEQARLNLLIDDIHCAACCWLLENFLSKIAGIDSVTVNLATHKATIVFNPKQIAVSTIFTHIANIGYSALPGNEDQLQQHAMQQRKEDLKRLGLAGLIMMQTGMFSIALYAGDFQGIAAGHQKLIRVFSLLLSTLMLLYCARPFFTGAWRNLKMRSLGMDTPVSIALAGAWIASAHATFSGSGHVYFDSIAMFTFLLLLARFIESGSRNHPSYWHFRPSIPRHCKRFDSRGKASTTLVAQLKPGDRILIEPGEIIVADGIIIDGSASVDDSSITGEFSPIQKKPGDEVYAGSLNHDGRLSIEVTKASTESSLSRINALTEQAMQAKPAIATVAEKIASRFTLAVLLTTALSAMLWFWLSPATPVQKVFEICFAMLVVSCPCALSLATPAALSFAHNAFRARGVFILKNNVIEHLNKITHAFFDKTGTLTEGHFKIADIQATANLNTTQCLKIAQRLESVSNHPVSTAFREEASESSASSITPPLSFTLYNGEGIEARLESGDYRIGSQKFCGQWLDTTAPETTHLGTQHTSVWLVSNDQWLACFNLHDPVRENAINMIDTLRKHGLSTGILTGDASSSADFIAKKLGIDTLYKGVSASQKLEHIQNYQQSGQKILMVGDGINDAPVLAGANVSIAMGNASDISKSQADILLCSNELSDVSGIISHARKTLRIIRQNITWALLYNGSVLPLAALGWIPPWLAAIGMSLSSLAVIMNARRLQLPRREALNNG